ncbi:hypothetical protein V2P20_11470 [Methylobacter sp. Wu1]|uniref:hypothetical protein n=1 Tax=Methylobacter sp. Wu1 TaxID=3119359 RepID=UPI002F926B75
MSLLLGALSGLGSGLANVAEGRVQSINAAQLEQMRQLVDLAKEKRIAEMQERNHTRDRAERLQDEERAYQQSIDPERNRAIAKAAVEKQRVTDEYADSRYGTEFEQAVKLAAAKEKARSDARYSVKAQYSPGSGRASSDSSGKYDARDKAQVRFFENENKALQAKIDSGMLDEAQMQDAQNKIADNLESIRAITFDEGMASVVPGQAKPVADNTSNKPGADMLPEEAEIRQWKASQQSSKQQSAKRDPQAAQAHIAEKLGQAKLSDDTQQAIASGITEEMLSLAEFKTGLINSTKNPQERARLQAEVDELLSRAATASGDVRNTARYKTSSKHAFEIAQGDAIQRAKARFNK